MISCIKFPKGLTTKFIITYIVAFLIPSFFVFASLYNNAIDRTRVELVSTKRDSMTTARNYMENQFANIEGRNLLFQNVTELYGLFDPTVFSEKDIMYTYWKDFVALTKLNEYDNDSIEQLEFYSSNSVASSILPFFLPIQELYNREINEEFHREPDKMLFHGFWHFTSENGQLKMIYYSGLMNADASRLLGALSLTCNSSLIEQFLSSNAKDTATYLYWDGRLVYSMNRSERSDACLEEYQDTWSQSGSTVQVTLDSSQSILQSHISLPNQNLDIVQFEFLPSDSLTSGNAFLRILPIWVLIFFISSLLLFFLIFLPMRNVSQLARHMRGTTAPRLVPYPGKITRDEVGDLISAYNDLVNRTLQITDALHQNEILLKNAQIETLQAQLNPHFFYGTLESIRMIAESHGETLISEISYAFGNLMRYSLSREYFVPIHREIAIVQQYLDIQKKRLGDRFSVQWDVQVLQMDWDCPKFVLFSMVENVLVHDVGQTRKHVNIQIHLLQEGDDLSLLVENDGPGISPERLRLLEDLKNHPEKRKEMSSRNNGRSIFNIHDRLQLYYGNEYQFSIQSVENVKTVCSVRFHIKPQNIATLSEKEGEDAT